MNREWFPVVFNYLMQHANSVAVACCQIDIDKECRPAISSVLQFCEYSD